MRHPRCEPYRGHHGLPALLALLSLLAIACGSKQRALPKKEAPKSVIVVLSGHQTNRGRPFYVLVRDVDLKTYLAEPYTDVAAKVITPDDTVLAAEVIFPGRRAELRLPLAEDASLNIYFLFTKPGNPWKTRIESPVPRTLELDLGDDRILEPDDPDAEK